MNLLEHYQWDSINQYNEPLLEKLLQLIGDESILVSKSAVSSLSAYCLCAGRNLSKYFQPIYNALVVTFKKSYQKSVVLLCRLVECLGIASFLASDDDFNVCKNEIVFILKHVEETTPGLEDQRVTYLLQTWKRLISRMRRNAGEYTEYISRILIKVLSQCDEYRSQSVRRKSLLDLGSQIGPIEIDYKQLEIAFILLDTSLQHLDTSDHHFSSILGTILQSTKVAVSFIPDPSVGIQAISCLERLLRIVMKNDFQKVSESIIISSLYCSNHQ